MDIKSYLESGKLEQYCLEMFNIELEEEVNSLCQANPELKVELVAIEKTIEKLTQANAIEPPAGLRLRVLSVMGFSETIDLNDLPLTSRYSDYHSWLKALAALIPDEPVEEFSMHVLRQDNKIAQMLVISKINVPEEVHEDVAESFFILRGQCICKVGEEEFTLNPGDYLDIPLHLTHDVRLTSPNVVAILQHRF